MNEEHVLEVLKEALSHQFDDYTWEKLIDDCDEVLSPEEVQWAKQHTCYSVTKIMNTLSEEEWRTIHNALSAYQNTFVSVFLTEYTIRKKQEIQQLMDKVRDNYIAK